HPDPNLFRRPPKTNLYGRAGGGAISYVRRRARARKVTRQSEAELMVVRRGSRRLRLTGPLAALGGMALLIWSVHQGGATAVIDGVQRVGAAGITLVCLMGGLRGLIRAAAWRLCLDKEHRATLGSVFSAYLSGDAIGNVSPFGLFISEPSKIALLRPRID